MYDIKKGRKINKIIFVWAGRDEDYLDYVLNVQKVYEELFAEENSVVG